MTVAEMLDHGPLNVTYLEGCGWTRRSAYANNYPHKKNMQFTVNIMLKINNILVLTLGIYTTKGIKKTKKNILRNAFFNFLE